jgi:ubiquinone biosynthesis protein COQ9
MTAATSKLDALRQRLYEATLGHVAFDGWTAKALRAGAKSAGASAADIARAFPGGAHDLLDFHLQDADRKMIAAMRGGRVRRMKLGERVAFALRSRLEAAEPHREAVRRALIALALPSHARIAARGLMRTVDAIWREAGDRSTDFSYYTKRASLAAIYTATLLFWLDDDSEGRQATWDFLERRLAGIARIGRLRRRAESALDALRTGVPFVERILRAQR